MCADFPTKKNTKGIMVGNIGHLKRAHSNGSGLHGCSRNDRFVRIEGFPPVENCLNHHLHHHAHYACRCRRHKGTFQLDPRNCERNTCATPRTRRSSPQVKDQRHQAENDGRNLLRMKLFLFSQAMHLDHLSPATERTLNGHMHFAQWKSTLKETTSRGQWKWPPTSCIDKVQIKSILHPKISFSHF